MGLLIHDIKRLLFDELQKETYDIFIYYQAEGRCSFRFSFLIYYYRAVASSENVGRGAMFSKTLGGLGACFPEKFGKKRSEMQSG